VEKFVDRPTVRELTPNIYHSVWMDLNTVSFKHTRKIYGWLKLLADIGGI